MSTKCGWIPQGIGDIYFILTKSKGLTSREAWQEIEAKQRHTVPETLKNIMEAEYKHY